MLKEILNEIYAEDEEEHHADLVAFFKDNPNPPDSKVHKLATDMGIEPDELEERVYALLSSLLKGVGKHNDVPDEKFDEKELQMGIGVEQEHTNDKNVAKMIAKDHLMEIPDYYSRLKKMERKAGVKD